MKTMGLDRLYLVRPRCEINAEAIARASGATDVLKDAQSVATLDAALAGCRLVLGTTARPRSLDWPAMAPHAAAKKLAAEALHGDVALVFGTERTGLSNTDIEHCHARVTIPANPGYSSLNLAAAVQVLCYECRLACNNTTVDERGGEFGEAPLATADEMAYFYAHLERVLLASDFLDPANPRHLMRRLRRFYNRARPDQNELNILRGILTAVAPQERSRP